MSLEKIGKILKEENFIHLDFNNTESRFRKVFSKMEVMAAYDVLDQLILSRHALSLSIETPNSVYRGKDESFSNYLNERMELYGNRDITNSELTYLDQHHLRSKKNQVARSKFSLSTISVWRDRKLSEVLSREKSEYILITGFDTDCEVLINTLDTVDMAFVPIVVSDCVSCSSERKHFSALEILSRFSYVLDSRDIISIMES